MTKQKKLEDGLNRLFSSPKKTSSTPSEDETTKQDNATSNDAPSSKTSKDPSKTESSAPPKSHLIPVPATPSLPLSISDGGDVKVENSEKKSSDKKSKPPRQTNQKTAQKKSTPQPPPKPPAETLLEEPETSRPDIEEVENNTDTYADEQIVVFTLAGQLYGINISTVESIIKMQNITVVPRAPDYIEGVTNLRGNVVPVINLHKRLNIDEITGDAENRIIIVNINEVSAGMIVDAVNAVTHVARSNITPISNTFSTIDLTFTRAAAKIDGDLVIMLDLFQLLQRRNTR